jgi:V/A-type H+/Na+-transporting ATPase subunit I
MIVPMSKFSFLVYHKDYQEFLDQVRALGAVHLIEKQQEVPDEIREKYDLVKQIQAVLKTLEKREVEVAGGTKNTEGRAAFEEARDLLDALEHKVGQLNQLAKEMSHVRHWGDFSPETIRKLRDNDLHLKFYTVSTRKFQQSWLQEYPISVVGQHGGLTYFVLVQKGHEEITIDAEEMRPPEKPISELQFYHEQLRKEIDGINAGIDTHAVESMNAIKHYQLQVIENIAYDNALENTEKQAEEKVMMLEGWVPDTKKEAMLAFLEENNILHVVDKPRQKEKVPIMLKNQKFSEKFEMLGELYSLPKYNELDMTPFFAPFYMLFFGFCLGDAGYGLLMVVASLLLKKKVKKELKTVMGLVFYLGLSTILFGIIGGTVFGIPLYETGLPVYSTLAEKFAARDTDINQLLFYLALVFGGVQILFGMFLKVVNEVKQFGWGFAIGTIGWITLLVGGIGIYAFSMASGIPMDQLNTPLYILLGVSGLLILPLNNLGRNVFMNVGVGLWTTYNMVTGILGDLLSYIRLFALGISSAIMGFVFNSLAVEMSGSIPVLNILIMVIILVIGHSINIFMSGLGAFVHPMRLTFVEFYKNAGFSGGGKKYNPFRKIT